MLMRNTSKRLIRLVFVVTSLSVMIPAIALAQNAEVTPAATARVAPTEQQLVDHFPALNAERQLIQWRTVGYTRWQEYLRKKTRLRREAAQAHLRAARLAAAPASPPKQATVSYTTSSYTGGSVNWYAIASCESGGRWDLNTGNGFWGGLQFTPQTWFAYGGGPFSGVGPFPYSASAQIAVAERVLARQGIGAWPYCGRFG